MKKRWHAELLLDPYYSPNLTSAGNSFLLDRSKPEAFIRVFFRTAPAGVAGQAAGGKGKGLAFITDVDDINAIAIHLPSLRCVNKIQLQLRLREVPAAGRAAAERAADLSSFGNSEWGFFCFDPIHDSRGKQFAFSIATSLDSGSSYVPLAFVPFRVYAAVQHRYSDAYLERPVAARSRPEAR